MHLRTNNQTGETRLKEFSLTNLAWNRKSDPTRPLVEQSLLTWPRAI